MDWSEYQNAIFAAVETSNNSLIIEAVAGAGKTTTIVEAINHVPRGQSVAFMAFNKHIADELKRRITAPNARCMTLHSAGFSAWRTFLGRDSFSCKVDSGKTKAVIKEYTSVMERAKYGAELAKLVGIAKGSGIVPQGLDYHGILDDDDAVWEDLIGFYGLERDECSIEVARKVLRYSIELSQHMIDYDDMLFMPVIAGASFQKYDVIFVDECQDLNGIQVEIVDRMRKPTTRIVAVGDRHQAIYGWRGALSGAMDHIAKRFHCESLPLTVSYRCPKAIVKKAQEFVSHIQHHESAAEGRVVEYPAGWLLKDFRPTDAILCRNAKPLIQTAFLLIRNKISCRVLGRDIGQGLIKLIRKMRVVAIGDLIERLREYRESEVEKAMARDDASKVAALDDKLDTIGVFIDELDADATVDTLVRDIEMLFSDEVTDRLTLSTVHKSKGMEWPRVFILDAHLLMPSPYARQDWQRSQEQNLQYVAATRAKDELYYLSSELLQEEIPESETPKLEAVDEQG
jgi:DNA helicase II / ATP-dependent DNA helicase PcrA